MTLDDLKRQNQSFINFFGDFGLRHTFSERIVPKSLQINQDNLHMTFSTLNVDSNNPRLDPVGSKWPAHESIKDEYLLKSLFCRYRLRETAAHETYRYKPS